MSSRSILDTNGFSSWIKLIINTKGLTLSIPHHSQYTRGQVYTRTEMQTTPNENGKCKILFVSTIYQSRISLSIRCCNISLVWRKWVSISGWMSYYPSPQCLCQRLHQRLSSADSDSWVEFSAVDSVSGTLLDTSTPRCPTSCPMRPTWRELTESKESISRLLHRSEIETETSAS